MSSRKYVPNRLRGVLGAEDGSESPSPGSRSSSLRLKGRKSRPWRVDAASWKQQLQERKAVYDHFALPERVDEEQKETSKELHPSQMKRAISLPSNIMGSAESDQNQNLETIVTPRRGEQVEMVLKPKSTTTTPLSALLSSTANHQASDDSDSDADSCETNADFLNRKQSRAIKSDSIPSSPSSQQRKSSVLPHQKKLIAVDVASPGKSRRGKTRKDTDLTDSNSERIEYDINLSDLVASRSRDADIGIIDGVPTRKNRVFTPNSKVRLLRHVDSDDTEESTGFIVNEDGTPSYVDAVVNKSTVMEATEDFIDPSKGKNGSIIKNYLSLRKNKSNSRLVAAAEEKSMTRTRPQVMTAMYENEIYVYEKEEVSASRSPIIVRNDAESFIVQNSPSRRGGRRRPRPAPRMPELSAATSANSANGMVMGRSMDDNCQSAGRSPGCGIDDYNETKSNSTNSSKTQDGVCSNCGSDDEWSTRPVPSDEDECLEKRRWPLRKDTDSTTSSDADIISMMNDVVLVPSSVDHHESGQNLCDTQHYDTQDARGLDESETARGKVRLREQMASSFSPLEDKDDTNTTDSLTEINDTGTPKHEINDSGEFTATTQTALTPDPLQRARKTLLLSNFNRSMRSLQDSPLHSRRRYDQTMDDLSVENSPSRTIFVPLRSREPRVGNPIRDTNTRDISLNVLNDHGVYVSQYNENGIYVPPNTHSMQSNTNTPRFDSTKEVYNELGVFVPPVVSSQQGNTVNDDKIREMEKNNILIAKENSDLSITTHPSKTVHLDIVDTKLQDSVTNDEDNVEDSNVSEAVPPKDREGTMSRTTIGGNDNARIDDSETANKQSEVCDASQDEGEIESASTNKSDDGIDVALSVACTLVEDVQLTDSSEPDSELVSTNQNDMKSSLGVLSTELNGVIEDSSEKGNAKEGDDGSAVDKMVVIKQQVISDLKARISMIYTGNQICIETVGTSNNSESLLSGRRNRASQRNNMRETEETVQLNAELSDKVSSMNTDHHHIIESPGKVKSGQGKWKERMALKKAAKKRNSHLSRNHVNTCDEEKTNSQVGATTDLQHQEPPGEHPTLCKDEQVDPLEPADDSIPEAPIVEKSAENATEQSPDKIDSNDDDDTGHFKASGKKQDQSILMKSDESSTASAENSKQETMEQVRSNGKTEVSADVEHLNAAEIVGKINNVEDATNVQKCSKESLISPKAFNSESDPQENCPSKNDVSTEPTTAQANALDEQKNTSNNVPGEQGKIEGPKTDRKIGVGYTEALTTDDQEQREINELHTIPDNDNNQTVIQGMPQSKGKKWKDRLKKMKNSKKSSKPPTAKKDTENTQQQVNAPQSNNLGSSSTYSENSDRPTYKRVLSDLTAPPEEEPHSVSPATTENIESAEKSPSAKNDTDNVQPNHLGSSSISVGACSTHSENSSHRSTLNDDTSGLVAPVEEKSCLVSSSVAEHADNSSKNGGKRSNKWKNRLAKKKITKQDSMRTLQTDVKAKAGIDVSDVIEPPGSSKPIDSFVSKAVNPTSEPSTYSKDQHINDETNISSKVEKSEALGLELSGDRLDVPATQSETISRQAECNEQNQSVRRDLHESFTVFDAFLQGGHAGDSSKDQRMNEESNISEGVNKSEVSDPKYCNKTPGNVPFESGAISGMTEPKEQNPNIQQDLRKSFTVFDAFLNGGPVGAMPIDEESIYTELTVGEETMLQNSMHDHQNVFQEEEQSYMDFTMEESLQPSYVDQTIVSSIGPKDHKISPFMSNLLSSRMFQDDVVNQIPLKSMQDQQFQVEELERLDVGTKQFPTITVGVYDDDMTQITMGSLEGDDTDADVDVQIDLNKDDLEDEFFDAETTPLSRAPSSKSFGKKSGMSKSSRRSESAASTGSQVSCSESSKQRIAEILRKEIWSPDTNVVKIALEELEMEANKGYNFRSHIVRCGGVMTIMKAMETNPRCESVLVHCCSTLEKLALEPQTQVAVCEMEGISLIVRSMQDHVNNAELQESACAALATICRQQEANTEQDPMKDAAGAVPTLLFCMTRFPTNAIIQAKAFAAISNLCTGSHSQERLAELSKAGGIITLTMALQTPWESKNEKQEAISNLPIILRGLTDLHENDLPIPTEDDTSKLDGSSRTSNETESMSTMKDDNEKPKQNGSTIRTSRNITRSADGDTESVGSCFIEEIPELPIMESSLSNHIEEIPNLGEFPTMMSNLEGQNFDNDNPDSPGKKSTHGTSPDGTDGSNTGSDEQCIIQ